MLNETVHIIDAGNSFIKIARFEADELIEVLRFPSDDFNEIKTFILQNRGRYGLSSVLSDENTNEILMIDSKILLLQTDAKVPLKINYGTTNTLGMDRLCNAVYAFNRIETNYGVIVDIGTCIKFDIVHKVKGYIGGSISPGIELRYKALNDYTGKLPLLSDKTRSELVGTSTNLSIQSGVMNGINAEMIGTVEEYRKQFSSLTIFVTGGDAQNFELHSKNDIFADKNLTLIGLYEIYQQNV